MLADQKLFTYFKCSTSIVKAWLKVQNRPPFLNTVVVWKEQKPELITACKRSCWKAMFSQESVILSTEGG